MGRPERPVDPEAGPVQRLAHELRELRRAAGGPSYRTMAKKAGFAPTTLSQAATGDRLPSWAVVEGYVRACGGDPAEWEPRWKEAGAATACEVREDEAEAAAPYRGLARFELDDRHLFFGRDRIVEDLRRLVCDHRLAVLFGPSGSGKSSLLRAGLLPRLREAMAENGNPAVLRVLTPGARPVGTYGHLLAPAEDEPESWVVVDQFEEVFTLCRDAGERARFIEMLLSARDPDRRLKVLISVRADFYARCAEHRDLADALAHAGLLLGPMTADELREAVVKPAQEVGLLVERELTARIIEEVDGRPGGLPMLSHALLETWRRRRSRLLTLAAYEAAGGVRGAIAATAEEVYGQLTPDQARTARHLLLRMVEPGQGTTPDTRHPLPRAELQDYPNPDVGLVVDRLARARLVTTDEDGVQLAHEALITCWPRLSAWIEEDRERLRHHRRLTEVAHAWQEHGRDPGALYRGTALTRAEKLFPDGDLLTATEQAFLAAALDARDADQRAAVRTARRSRALLTALSAVLVIALVVSLVAWSQHLDNVRQATNTAARRIASVADALRTTDPRTAMLLGVAAWRVSPLPESRRALLGSLAQPEQDAFTDPAPGVGPRRYLADSGRTLLDVAAGHWVTWDVVTHKRTGAGRVPQGIVLDAAPDGRVLVISQPVGIRLWDTRTSRWTGPSTPMPEWTTVDIGNGSAVVRDTDDDRVRARSVGDGSVLFETRSPGDLAPVLSADGRSVAVCPAGGAPQVWDVAGHRRLPGAWENTSGLCKTVDAVTGVQYANARVSLSASGDRLLSMSSAGVRVWNTRTGRQEADLKDSGVRYASLSTDGTFLATADDSEVRVWRLSAPDSPVLRRDLNNQHPYGGLAWDPSRPVLRYLEGSTVHSLDLGTAVTSTWQDPPFDKVLLSPDGHTLATARLSGSRYTVQLRSTRDGHLLRSLPTPALPVSRDPRQPVAPSDTLPLLAFDDGGTVFAYGVSAPGNQASPQRLTVWDVRHDRARAELDLATASTGPVVNLALGPSGRTAYAGRVSPSGDLAIEAWDTARARRTRVVTGVTGVTGPAFAVSPDGRLLVGDNRTATLPSGQLTERALVLGSEVGAFAFGADGSLLAAGDGAGRVALWDGRLRQRSGVLRNVFPASLGPTPQSVSALAFSPDGRTLAVGGDAGTLQLWDTETQQPLGDPLTTPGDPVDSLSFSPDGTTVYAAGAHVPLQRYLIDPVRAVAEVCARAGHADLTRAQWRTYVGDVPYQRVCGQ
ncbi:helix-turn-helix domain-containing protein [Streptomyces sp. NPDC001351]|uniref:nSTAND1 domain-containing NTPase n=1 Tax=Streptomyces sp. NPDC001351 TaxID=3364564 RepID=UPI0036827C77